jgi:hypothetical protein
MMKRQSGVTMFLDAGVVSGSNYSARKCSGALENERIATSTVPPKGQFYENSLQKYISL